MFDDSLGITECIFSKQNLFCPVGTSKSLTLFILCKWKMLMYCFELFLVHLISAYDILGVRILIFFFVNDLKVYRVVCFDVLVEFSNAGAWVISVRATWHSDVLDSILRDTFLFTYSLGQNKHSSTIKTRKLDYNLLLSVYLDQLNRLFLLITIHFLKYVKFGKILIIKNNLF